MKYLFLILFLTIQSWAQESNFVERSVEVTSRQTNASMARKEMVEKAMESISEELIKDVIGEAKYSRNRALIHSKIIKDSGRFIPFSKTGEVQEVPGSGFKMTMNLKVNRGELEKLLLEHGLFYESDGTPIILPMIRWSDRVNLRSYGWWQGEGDAQNQFLSKASRKFESVLRSSFLKSNFYVLEPQSLKYYQTLPANFRTENLREDDLQILAQRWNAQIVVDGNISILKSADRSEAYGLHLRFAAFQAGNGRMITEVVRVFETDSGNFETVVERKMKEAMDGISQDLSSQVLEAWQKGAIGASLYRLTISGRLGPAQQEAFKELLKSKLKDIKNVTERFIASDRVVYEIDSPVGPQELVRKLPQFEVKGIRIIADGADEKNLNYKVSR